MKELVIFCESYPSIHNCLYVTTHNHHKRSITIVIPGNRDLFKFFNVINERLFNNAINIIYFEPYKGRRTEGRKINQIVYRIPEIIKEKRYLKGVFDNHLAQLEGADVFFFARDLAQVTFYFLEKLRKRNRLVYMYGGDHVIKVDEYTPNSIVDLISLVILKLVYGRDIVIIKLPGYPRGAPYIPDRFINKKVDKVIGREERNEMLRDFDLDQFKIFDAGNYGVIYFDDSLSEIGYIADKDTFGRKLAEIFNILSKYFPEKEIARKYHPHYPGDKATIKIGDVLPDFIPAELLYNKNVKMYLGACSNCITNVGKGLAVSLIDLISFKNDKIREHLKEALIQRSRSEILFPQSLEEFERILINMKGRTV